jgi:hypothetical protein
MEKKEKKMMLRNGKWGNARNKRNARRKCMVRV